MKKLLMILIVVNSLCAGNMTGAEIISAPTIVQLNDKLARLVTEYVVVGVSEPVQVGNEICVTVSLGTPPGISGVEIVTAPSVPLMNTILAEKGSDYPLAAVSVPSLLLVPAATGSKPAATKQLCVTVCMGKK